MLVLTRQINETICIGDDIKVTICLIRGDKCRIGITAPPHVKVDREEIRIKIEAEQAATDSDCD